MEKIFAFLAPPKLRLCSFIAPRVSEVHTE